LFNIDLGLAINSDCWLAKFDQRQCFRFVPFGAILDEAGWQRSDCGPATPPLQALACSRSEMPIVEPAPVNGTCSRPNRPKCQPAIADPPAPA